MPRLMIVVGSVREGRVGLPIAEWVRQVAEADGRFEIDFADLAEIALPFMDEPNHPRLRQYTKSYTIEWSKRVDAADVFLLAFPEYNFSFGPAIKNALDYLYSEWNRKPVGFVNWGGNSSGTRAQTALRPVIGSLGMVITRGMSRSPGRTSSSTMTGRSCRRSSRRVCCDSNWTSFTHCTVHSNPCAETPALTIDRGERPWLTPS